jgi:subtilisin family serine protease
MKYTKITPSLLSVIADFDRQDLERARTRFRTMALFGATDAMPDARVSVLLHCEPDADFRRHADQGIIVNQRKGRVRTAFLPLRQIGRLSEDTNVRQLVASRYLDILMDVAPGVVNLPKFRVQSGLSGQNVIVGIVDTGIDSTHPAFAGRIHKIWDQTLKGTGVPEGPYGTELLPKTFGASSDTNGHGTHVSGIAAGDTTTYPGVASRAEYVIVKTDFGQAHVADGVNYIFRVAEDLKRPVVVNLSMGSHYDPHDGTDLLSLSLDSQSGPGKIICCAAGNEGEDDIHAAVTLLSSDLAIRFALWPSSSSGPIKGELNGWYSGKDQFEISVIDPGGAQTPFQKIITSGRPNQDYSLPEGQVRIVTPGRDPTNRDHNFLIEIQPLTIPEEGDHQDLWQLVLRAATVTDGRVDIWAVCDAVFARSAATDEMKIGSPGACSSAITVAAYSTKNQWTDIQKRQQSETFSLNTITPLSSPGPLRNGAKKPDLAAPGALIAAPASGSATTDPRLVVAPGYYLNAGTSMATPFISGIIALLLERDPRLDPDGIKRILHSAGTVPGQSAGTFDPKWGYGLLNALGI